MSAGDRIVLAQFVVLDRVRTAARALRHRVMHLADDEAGQTPTEYLMIVGLMAAVIVVVFVTLFFPTFREAAAGWTQKVKDAVLGTNIQ